MKKVIKLAVLLILTLVLFTSCHDCAVCGKSKLITTKKTILGKDVYVCNDCKNAPEKALSDIKQGVKEVEKDVKNLFK